MSTTPENQHWYWQDRHDTLEAILSGRSVADVGIEEKNELLRIQDFKQYITDILAWVSDTLMPRGMDGVSATIQLLEDRVSLE